MAAPSRAQQAGIGGLIGAALVVAVPVVGKLEGRRLDPYWDIVHVRSVCDGETVGIEERRYTPAECDAMTLKSLSKHGVALQTCLPATTPVPTYAAFMSFSYNVGSASACGSTAARLMRQGDIRGACDSLMMWVKVTNPVTHVKYVSQGVVNRRTQERALCLEGL